MLAGTKSYLYLIIDQASKGVITYSHSASISNAVSKGIMNSSCMMIHFPFLVGKHDINRYLEDLSLNYKLVKKHNPEFSNFKFMDSEMSVAESTDFIQSGKIFDLVPMNQDLITDGWLEKRRLGNFRVVNIRSLEMNCDRYLSRFKQFSADDMIFPYLSEQLQLVNVDQDIYPASIIEWAMINSMTPRAAYTELKMQKNSMDISIMRIHAIWNKYVEKFNAVSTAEQLTSLELFGHLESELKFGEK
jgi:hypothetical protein